MTDYPHLQFSQVAAAKDTNAAVSLVENARTRGTFPVWAWAASTARAITATAHRRTTSSRGRPTPTTGSLIGTTRTPSACWPPLPALCASAPQIAPSAAAPSAYRPRSRSADGPTVNATRGTCSGSSASPTSGRWPMRTTRRSTTSTWRPVMRRRRRQRWWLQLGRTLQEEGLPPHHLLPPPVGQPVWFWWSAAIACWAPASTWSALWLSFTSLTLSAFSKRTRTCSTAGTASTATASASIWASPLTWAHLVTASPTSAITSGVGGSSPGFLLNFSQIIFSQNLIKPPFTHLSGKTLKDVHYNQNRRNYAGEVQISLKMVRIDKDPLGYGPYSFRKSRRRCAWDSVLSWQSITITVSLLVLFVVGFFALCVCSNSNCSSEEGHSVNWCLCCLCCCRCCRRRRRGPLPSRPLVERTQPPNRPSAGHGNHSAYRSHAPPPPPPPPAPPSSSMSSSRNANTYSRKPTFSTTSYSYDGNGSNPTGQSSSAMSTALETDDESANNNTNGTLGGRSAAATVAALQLAQFPLQSNHSNRKLQSVGKLLNAACFLTYRNDNFFNGKTKRTVALHSTGSFFCSPSTVVCYNDRKIHQQKLLPFCFISTAGTTCQQMEWIQCQKLLQELFKNCQWFKSPTNNFEHKQFFPSSLTLNTIGNHQQNEPKRSTDLTAPELLYLYFFYCQLRTWQVTLGQRCPPSAVNRDLFPQCASKSAKLVTCRSAAYHHTASFDQLLPSLWTNTHTHTHLFTHKHTLTP